MQFRNGVAAAHSLANELSRLRLRRKSLRSRKRLKDHLGAGTTTGAGPPTGAKYGFSPGLPYACGAKYGALIGAGIWKCWS